MDVSEVPGHLDGESMKKLIRLWDVVEYKSVRMDDGSLKMESVKHEMRMSSVSVAQALPMFNGTTSPWEHAFRYYMTMSAAGATPMEIISLFSMTLNGPIKMWCLALNNLSGYSWEDLAQTFIKKSEEMSHEVGMTLKSPEPESLPKPLVLGGRMKPIVIDLEEEDLEPPLQVKKRADEVPRDIREKGIEEKSRRRFSELGRPVSKAYGILKEKGFLVPLDVTPKNPHKLRKDKYCEYHGHHGHDTDKCIKLRHAIQDLIDDGTVADPSKIASKA